MNGIAKKGENILDRDVEVVVDEEIILGPNAVLLAPSESADSLQSVVEVLVDEVELKRAFC
jgi:hypothetical protein